MSAMYMKRPPSMIPSTCKDLPFADAFKGRLKVQHSQLPQLRTWLKQKGWQVDFSCTQSQRLPYRLHATRRIRGIPPDLAIEELKFNSKNDLLSMFIVEPPQEFYLTTFRKWDHGALRKEVKCQKWYWRNHVKGSAFWNLPRVKKLTARWGKLLATLSQGSYEETHWDFSGVTDPDLHRTFSEFIWHLGQHRIRRGYSLTLQSSPEHDAMLFRLRDALRECYRQVRYSFRKDPRELRRTAKPLERKLMRLGMAKRRPSGTIRFHSAEKVVGSILVKYLQTRGFRCHSWQSALKYARDARRYETHRRKNSSEPSAFAQITHGQILNWAESGFRPRQRAESQHSN